MATGHKRSRTLHRPDNDKRRTGRENRTEPEADTYVVYLPQAGFALKGPLTCRSQPAPRRACTQSPVTGRSKPATRRACNATAL